MALRHQPIDGLSIQGRVIRAMRDRIISGELEPGTSLSEIALAEAFEVSRTPVREALKQLQTEGLVQIRPRVGTFVTAPSRREVNELFELKGLLEGAAARLLSLRGSVPELTRLQENLAAADAAVAAGDTDGYADLVHGFHGLLVDGADNLKLQDQYRRLMNQLAYPRLVKTSLGQPGRPRQSDTEHHRVFELIQAKDGDAAERAMRAHVRASHRSLMDGLYAAEQHRPAAAQA